MTTDTLEDVKVTTDTLLTPKSVETVGRQWTATGEDKPTKYMK
jgi:hypothetical protein